MLWQRGNGTLRAAERASVSRRPEPEGGAVPALWLSGAAARDCSFLSPAVLAAQPV
ncbi:rCG46281, isoform CRA_b [Rattus norvegicus]|uniref:RCG46281, isoform CRA_b n=1 Tax=Rattus norvegicus TaxID=10116 RepID=A6ICC4_RAT|nr:rCG46281, isoform CRA_b [Rattus norvegicus]